MSAETSQNHISQGTWHLLGLTETAAGPHPHPGGTGAEVPSVPGKMATEDRVRSGEEGLSPTPSTHASSARGEEGGAQAACRETWGGGGEHCLLGASLARALLHNLAPAHSCSSTAAPLSRNSLIPGFKTPREFLNLLNHSFPPLPPPFQDSFSYFLPKHLSVSSKSSAKSNHWILKLLNIRSWL